jgi:hypothetical protein
VEDDTGQLTAGAGVYSTIIWAVRLARAQITASVAVMSPLAMPWVMRRGPAVVAAAEARLVIEDLNASTRVTTM